MSTSTPQRAIRCGLVIVAVTMEHLPVRVGILAINAQWHDVVYFQPVSISQVESAPCTSSVLPFEQLRYSLWHSGMMPQFARPVHPVPIVWTLASTDFDVPPDQHLCVLKQLHTVVGCEVPFAGFGVPVPTGDPPS